VKQLRNGDSELRELHARGTLDLSFLLAICGAGDYQFSESGGEFLREEETMHGSSLSTRRRTSIVLASACTGLFAIAWPAVSSADTPFGLSNSNDLIVNQVDYENDAGSDVSSNAQLIINQAQVASESGISGGYVNIADSNGNWLAQNVPMLSGTPFVSAEVPLATADGVNDSGQNIGYQVEVSQQPQASFTTVSTTNFTIGGEDVEDDEGEGAPVKPAKVGKSGVQFTIGGTNRFAIVSQAMPNVNAANNQCAPASIANALQYLKNTKGLKIPDPNVAGRGALAGTLKDPSKPAGATYAANTVLVPNGQNTSAVNGAAIVLPFGNYTTNETAGSSLVGQMDLAMSRFSQNRARYYTNNNNPAGNANDGVGGQDQNNGTEKYLGGVGDAGVVQIDTQGNIIAATNAGITNSNKGGTITADFLYNELNGGAAVKVGYNGHATDLVATGSILGQPFVFLTSDFAQTPQNDALDAKLNLLANLPNGFTNADSIPEFSFLVEGTQTLPTLGVGIINAIAINVVPEPGVMALAFGGATLLLRRKRRV
jgi:hypothetical protein